MAASSSPLRRLIDRHAVGAIPDDLFVAQVVALDPPTAARYRDPSRPDDVLEEAWAEEATADYPEPGTRDEIIAAADAGLMTRHLRDVILDRLARRAEAAHP